MMLPRLRVTATCHGYVWPCGTCGTVALRAWLMPKSRRVNANFEGDTVVFDEGVFAEAFEVNSVDGVDGVDVTMAPASGSHGHGTVRKVQEGQVSTCD